MVHLAVHLPREALITGPVHPRWMYPIERNLGSLKTSVCNKACPKGSIAQAYIVKESLNFMSMYLKGIETRFNQRSRNYDGPQGGEVEDLSIFSVRARPFGHDRCRIVKSGPSISDEELEKTHQFILRNCEEVELYLNIYKVEIHGLALDKARLFKKHINDLLDQKVSQATEGLWALANGPFRLDTKCYKGCLVNEVRFHTKDRDGQRCTQNSGLVVEGFYKNKKMEFFGFSSRVVELVYAGNRKVALFECEWFDTRRKKIRRVDKHFISINVESRWYKEDPFVLPIHVKQVFYINDTKLGKTPVQRVQRGHLWDLPRLLEDTNVNLSHSQEPLPQFESGGVRQVIEDEDVSRKLVRDDLEAVEVDENLFHKIRNDNNTRNQEEDDEDDEIELENWEISI